MIEFSFETLRPLGLTSLLAQTLTTADAPVDSSPHASPAQWMRTAVVHRETVEVHDGVQQLPTRCTARLTRSLLEMGSALAVGDWVLCQRDEHQQVWVTYRASPVSQIVRRDADGSRHTVVSNVDIALLVMGLDLDFNLKRLERYLALVGSSGVVPVVVLTKADVAQITDSSLVERRIQEVRQRVGNHVDVVAVDARTAEASTALNPYLSFGHTLVLLGSSGAGKSTLTNSLLGSSMQDTGAVREHDSRGKHTTTARSLHLLPSGACVIDTPGVRTLRPDVDAQTLSSLFEDVSTLASSCRFRDCCHQDEPGCAVRAQVNPDRLRNYHKMLRESRRDTMNVLERQQQLSQWKARGRAGRQRLEMKRDGRWANLRSQTEPNLAGISLRRALKPEERLEVDMPNLVPMTQPEFDAFLARAIPLYAEGKIKAGNWLESEAFEKSQKEYAELLPHGLQSIDNCLYTLHDGSDAVGLIWMKINLAANRAFICDLYCEERFRGKGYGKMLMLHLEDEARGMGLRSLGLHVFGSNHVARNLYEAIGYEITNLNMSKTL